MKIGKLLEQSPAIEIAVRNVYWRTPALAELKKRVDAFDPRRISARFAKKREPAPEPVTSIERVLPELERWGLRRGDLVVLHSGYRSLRAGRASPDRILDALLEFLGPEGTLALPSIPALEGEPQQHDRMTADVRDLVCSYDPETTPAWTGAVPNAAIKRKGSFRSLHPLNSMVAIGPLAEAMMEGNVDGDRPFACGPTSSWAFCARHGAKVLALGADMAHSLTMIHVAEDLKGEDWPVTDWYRDRRFRIKERGAWREIAVRERHPRWAMYYGERTLSRDLVREGISLSTQVEGVNVEALRGDAMLRYLDSRNHTLYPYFFIPPWDRKRR